MSLNRSRLRNAATFLIAIFVLYQVWQKVHIVMWVHIQWWQLLLIVIGVIVVLDLLLEALFKDRW